MSMDPYGAIAIFVGAIAFVVAVACVMREAWAGNADGADLTLLSVVAVIGAGMAGGFWPVTVVVAPVLAAALAVRRRRAQESDKST